MSTRVKFIVFKGEIIALFPDDVYNDGLYGKSLIMSYQHMGQHGAASASLMKCKRATVEQYSGLLNELRAIGYDDLEVTNEVKETV